MDKLGIRRKMEIYLFHVCFLNIDYTRFKIMIYGDNLILSAKIYNENFFTSSNLLYDQLVFL